MGIQRPDHSTVAVDVDTLGATATTLDTLRGLPGWGGDQNIGLSFGDASTFTGAGGLGEVHDAAMTVAWGVAKRVEKVTCQHADAVAEAAEAYGETDKHSAAAVNAAARGMSGSTRNPDTA